MIHDPLDDISPDLQLDRTLQALGAAYPSTDFNARLLARLEARDPATPIRRPSFLLAFGAHLLAASALLLLAGLGLLLAHPHPRSSLNTSSLTAEHHSSTATQPSGQIPDQTTSSPMDVNVLPPARPQPQLFHLSLSNARAEPRTASSATSPTAADLDQQALADLHAPSQSAPPLPLTAQERLVGLMLRHGEQHDLAELDPERQEAFARQERSAFHEFFDPPIDPRILHQNEPVPAPQPAVPTQPPTEGTPQ